jgi:hypothetical protein
MTTIKSVAFFLLIPALLSDAGSLSREQVVRPRTDAAIVIYPDQPTGQVSPLVMGFNVPYCYATDQSWEPGGPIPALLKELNTRILRYPAGTVTTFYHWQHLTGQGWKDSWSPTFNTAKNSPPSAYMDLDEYLDVCRRLKTEPLIGINMGSGMKYNRLADGIREARALMLHCREKGVKVTYYYLGNEPYQKDANFTFTAAQYAAAINRYVPAMKKINNDIRIIVNTHPRDLTYTRTLINRAGKNIDFIDIHYYWKWGHATFANWKSETVMRQGRGLPYKAQRPFYRKLADSLGYPRIDLVSLEWNLGRIGKGNPAPSQAQVALMAAEEFTQFIQSGMRIATFWPVSWPKPSRFDNRILLDAQQGYRPNKVYDMFKLFKNTLSQNKVKSESSDQAIQVLSVKSTRADTLWVYVINKTPKVPVSNVTIHIGDPAYKPFRAVGFSAADDRPGPLKIDSLVVENKRPGNFRYRMPAYSLAKITFVR